MKVKKRLKKQYYYILLIIFLSVFLYSIYNIINYKVDENTIDNEINEIIDDVTINEVNDDNSTIIEQTEEIKKNNPYWDYIKMNLIDVDFNKLKETNNEVKGWIQVNGTSINYPFVQAKDNEYYLTHSFNKSKNASGWVFMDYRNDITNQQEKNTILYAHGMKNKTMFGSLRDIFSNGWLNKKENYVVKLSTEYENTLWQVFSVYRIPTTSDYIKTSFKTDEDYESFLNMLLNRSQKYFETPINKNDRILTLSTCFNKKEKVVIHAKLIKKENK